MNCIDLKGSYEEFIEWWKDNVDELHTENMGIWVDDNPVSRNEILHYPTMFNDYFEDITRPTTTEVNLLSLKYPYITVNVYYKGSWYQSVWYEVGI